MLTDLVDLPLLSNPHATDGGLLKSWAHLADLTPNSANMTDLMRSRPKHLIKA